MKFLAIVVLFAVLAFSASAEPTCEEFVNKISSNAASKLYALCTEGSLSAWFCPCFGGIVAQ